MTTHIDINVTADKVTYKVNGETDTVCAKTAEKIQSLLKGKVKTDVISRDVDVNVN